MARITSRGGTDFCRTTLCVMVAAVAPVACVSVTWGDTDDQQWIRQKVRLTVQAWDMAAEDGWIQGLKTIDLIRPEWSAWR